MCVLYVCMYVYVYVCICVCVCLYKSVYLSIRGICRSIELFLIELTVWGPGYSLSNDNKYNNSNNNSNYRSSMSKSLVQ